MSLLSQVKSRLGERGSVRQRYLSVTFWSLVASVSSRSLSLVVTVVCARILGQTHFGEYGILLTTANMVGALAAIGLGVTATRYVADLRERDPERVGRIVGLAWLMAFASGSVMMLISIVSARWTAREMLHAESLAGPLRLASVIILLNAMLAFQNGALAGLEVFRKIASVNVVAGLVAIPLNLLGVWKFGLYGLIGGTVAAQFLTWLLSERLLLRECRSAGVPLSLRGGLREVSVFWTFSLPALLGAFSTMPIQWFCTVLIVRSPHGFDQMALYTAADRWRLAILFIPNALFQAALPMMSNMHRSDPQSYKRVAKANLWVNMALVLAPVLVITAISPQIMGTYGHGFRSGWPVLAVFAVGTIPEALNTILGYPLITQGRMWARFWYDILLGAALLVVALWLIPTHGTFGYVIAYLVSYSVTSFALYIDLRVTRKNPFTPAEAPVVVDVGLSPDPVQAVDGTSSV